MFARPFALYPQNCPKTAGQRQRRRKTCGDVTPTTIVIGSVAGPLTSSLRVLKTSVVAAIKRLQTNEYYTCSANPTLVKQWEAYLESVYLDKRYQERVMRSRQYEERVRGEHKKAVRAFLFGEDAPDGFTTSLSWYDKEIIYNKMASINRDATPFWLSGGLEISSHDPCHAWRFDTEKAVVNWAVVRAERGL